MITIHKNTAGKHGLARVTFSVPAVEGCGFLYLVGCFDGSGESVYQMRRTQAGNWSLTLELEPGCEYHYRFRTSDGRWLDDPAVPPAPAAFELAGSYISGSALSGSAGQMSGST